MTQHELITKYIEEHGSILPAKCYGLVYKDQMLGSETSKRCRELRAKGVLRSVQEGKFERFYLTSGNTIHIVNPLPKLLRMTDKVRIWNQQFQKPAQVKNTTQQSMF